MSANTAPQTSPSPVRRRLGSADLRRRFGVSDMTIWRWERDGKLPKAHYVNGRKKWFEDELDAAEAAGLTKSYDERHAALGGA